MAGNSSLALKDFFGNSDYERFEIPMYQRSYSWTGSQVGELWSDIENLDDGRDSTHFIGLFVMTEDESAKKHMQIVDGQQRVTTISILLSSIRDLLWESLWYEPEITGSRLSYTINGEIMALNKLLFTDTSNEITKLKPNENDEAIYKEVIAWLGNENDAKFNTFEEERVREENFRLKSEEIKTKSGLMKKNRKHKMVKAYEQFIDEIRKKLKGLEPVERIYGLFSLQKKILERLRVMTFVEDENGAFDLFESLNDRGLKLAAIDLIKNRVLRKVSQENRGVISEKWDSIFGKDGILSSEKQDIFLRAHWNATDNFIMKSELYKSYRDRIDKTFSPLDFVNELEYSAETYAFLRGGYYGVLELPASDDLHKILRLLRKSGSFQWLSLAIPLIKIIREEYESENKNKTIIDNVRSIFWLILNIIIRFQIFETRFNKIEKPLPEIAVEISRGYFSIKDEKAKLEFLDTIQKKLTSLMDAETPNTPMDEEKTNGELISEFLKEKSFDGNDLAALLIELASYTELQHSTGIVEKLTLEHVLPIKHGEWDIEDKDAEAFKYKLGNMLVLEKPLNSSLQNNTFEVKKVEYLAKNVKEDFYPEQLRYGQLKTWDKETVGKRTEDISNLLGKMLSVRKFVCFAEMS